MATVAGQLVQTLREAGVTRIYGVVGDSLNPIVDAIRRTEGIEWVHVRHEETAAFAAAAEAQLTTDPNALSIPPKVTAAQVRGFTLGISRTVLDGGVGKMTQMARSNLRNIPRP